MFGPLYTELVGNTQYTELVGNKVRFIRFTYILLLY